MDNAALFARRHGLEGGPKIRVRNGREFAEARDGYLLIKQRVLDLFQQHQVAGYETRQIPYTEWHVIRITTRVPYKDFTPKRDKQPCKTCGRGAYYGGAHTLKEIALPDHQNTLFAPELERTNAYDIFMTESVANMLKSSKAKGGLLDRLLTDEEYQVAMHGSAAAKRKLKDLRIYLT